MKISFEELDKMASMFSRIHPAAAMKVQQGRLLKKSEVYLLILGIDMPDMLGNEPELSPENQVTELEKAMLKLDLAKNLDECLAYLNAHFRNYEYPYELIA